MDTGRERAMHVAYGDDIYTFTEGKDGLYYIDTADLSKHKQSVMSYCFIQTVKDNKRYFTDAENKSAERARLLQVELGWPSISTLKHIISTNQVRNSHITLDDIDRAE